MNKTFFVTLASMLSAVCLWGQDISDIQRINELKKSSDYLYAESTSKEWEDAYANAKTLLEATIEDWVSNQPGYDEKSSIVAKSEELFVEIKTRRGELYRAFVYVKKSDLFSYSRNDQLLVIPPKGNAMPEAEDKLNDTLTERTAGKAEEKVVEPDPSVEVIIVQEAYRKSEEPEVETRIADEDRIRSLSIPENDFQKEFMEMKLSADINVFLKNSIARNMISAKGQGKNTIPAEGDILLVIYNREGRIPAHLKRKGELILNMDRNVEDSLDNYHGCGVIWIKENKN